MFVFKNSLDQVFWGGGGCVCIKKIFCKEERFMVYIIQLLTYVEVDMECY